LNLQPGLQILANPALELINIIPPSSLPPKTQQKHPDQHKTLP